MVGTGDFARPRTTFDAPQEIVLENRQNTRDCGTNNFLKNFKKMLAICEDM